ncbi:GNAT family N-acetyltransferase [Microbacterium sp. B2969]|uniref:GNAT family N-acetyltransferase n=1 Tax=Microbacterium alkaliflavum TaxID=3248839 RepID=A0ABW7Q869_9MICO
MEPVTLRTARFELTLPEAGDVDAIYDACQDSGIRRYTTVPTPYEHHHAEEFIARAAKGWADGIEYTWVVRDAGALAGMVGLYRPAAGQAELGYWTAPAARGRGVMTEASRAVVDWGFSADGLGLARMEWRAVVGNVPSARIARTLGFGFEGTLRGALRNGAGDRDDGWIAGLLLGDDRTPKPWPVLEA